jgi:hypothetical protein
VRASTLVGGALLVALTACSSGPSVEPVRVADSPGAQRSEAPSTVDPARDGVLRLLFLGNSHTARHDVPGTVASLLRAADRAAEVEAVLGPGSMHLQERAEHAPTLDLLESEPWDVVVLQAQDYSLSGRYTYPTGGAEELVRRVRALGAEPVLYAEWPRRGVPETSRILWAYGRVATSGACLPPVPEAFDLALTADPDLTLHAADGNHSSPAGAFLASAVLAGALLGRPVTDAPEVVRVPEARQRQLLRVAGGALRDLPPDRRCSGSAAGG